MKLVERFKDKVIGVLKGLDRVRFRGTIRSLANNSGMTAFLCSQGILFKDFGAWANSKTLHIRKHCDEYANSIQIPVLYLNSSGVDKEAMARKIGLERGIVNGSICMFSTVEACKAPRVKGSREEKKLRIEMEQRKCVYLYHYFDHPLFGFGHVRLQTWLPFTVHICINGRHWLEKEMIKAKIPFVKDSNCFPWIKDVDAAQALMDKQQKTNWPQMLNDLLGHLYPDIESLYNPIRPDYYWSADETEWATDIMFKSISSLDTLYPQLINHAMNISDSPTVMRYFGKRNITQSGKIKGCASTEIVSDYRKRYEGVRTKHWVDRNSVKMYNKSGSILRVETTINDTRKFKVYRHPNDDKSRPASIQKMRKGVSDLTHRCKISDRSNVRYSDSIATLRISETLKEIMSPYSNPIESKGRRYRGLNQWSLEDYKLIKFLGLGEHAIDGFRNKDLRRYLYGDTKSNNKKLKKRLSGRTTRRLQILRAHGLIRKVPRTHKYILTEKGQKLSSAVLGSECMKIEDVIKYAA